MIVLLHVAMSAWFAWRIRETREEESDEEKRGLYHRLGALLRLRGRGSTVRIRAIALTDGGAPQAWYLRLGSWRCPSWSSSLRSWTPGCA